MFKHMPGSSVSVNACWFFFVCLIGTSRSFAYGAHDVRGWTDQTPHWLPPTLVRVFDAATVDLSQGIIEDDPSDLPLDPDPIGSDKREGQGGLQVIIVLGSSDMVFAFPLKNGTDSNSHPNDLIEDDPSDLPIDPDPNDLIEDNPSDLPIDPDPNGLAHVGMPDRVQWTLLKNVSVAIVLESESWALCIHLASGTLIAKVKVDGFEALDVVLDDPVDLMHLLRAILSEAD